MLLLPLLFFEFKRSSLHSFLIAIVCFSATSLNLELLVSSGKISYCKRGHDLFIRGGLLVFLGLLLVQFGLEHAKE